MRRWILAILFVHPLGAQSLTDHRELAAIYAADQTDRAPGALDGLTQSVRDSVMRSVIARDTVRRLRVEALMKSGAARTANDFYHASLVIQHGRDTLASLMAHDWARRAIALDSTHAGAKGMIAASWDQYQYRLGRPTWYSVIVIGGLREPARMYAVDSTRVTDAERLRLGLQTLAEQRVGAARRVAALNARRPPQ